MVVSLLLGTVGLLEVVAPKRVVDFWFDLATEDGGGELRPWVYTAARVEGLLVLLLLLSRRRRGSPDA